MSFILDALRKAEDGRQTAPVPSVPITPAAVPDAPPNTRRRVLGIVVVIALAAGLAAAWVMTRPAETPASTRAAPLPAPSNPPATERTAPQPAPATSRQRTPVRALDQEASRGAPPPARPEPSTPAAATPTRSAPARSAESNPSPAITPGTVTVMEPQDIAAFEAGNAPSNETSGEPDAFGNLPDYENMLRSGRVSMTNLSLDMHVYNSDPAKRFVFINMRKYREGDRVGDKATIEQITDYGAILDDGGQLFVLRPQ